MKRKPLSCSCATRDAVRRLRASLTERGFPPLPSRESIARPSATMRSRPCAAKGPGCVATDVAARGIDLPSVSLVIHVELPRDAEALQHVPDGPGEQGARGWRC